MRLPVHLRALSCALMCLSIAPAWADENEDAGALPSIAQHYAGQFRFGFGGIADAGVRAQIFAGEAPMREILSHHANIIGINCFYPQLVHPREGKWVWETCDRLLAFAQTLQVPLRGHVLWWPFHGNSKMEWLLDGVDGKPVDRATAIARLREHIQTVVGRYKGRIQYWDVVNEVVDNHAPYGMREGAWKDALGEQMIELAFRFAHEADPQARLFYNDYGEWNPAKREAVYAMLRRLLDKGVPIHGIGVQDHVKLTGAPTPTDLDAALRRYEALGLEIHITEVDVDMNPDGKLTVFTPEMAQAQARRYRELFDVYQRHAGKITAVMTWNVTDRDSWMRRLPVPRPNWPLLFDENGRPKPAAEALVAPR
jgi:endo-1,4-beta-xylanase